MGDCWDAAGVNLGSFGICSTAGGAARVRTRGGGGRRVLVLTSVLPDIASPPSVAHSVWAGGVVASLVSAIVEMVDGRPPAAVIPMVANLLSDRLGISATGDFQDAISTALYTLVGPDGRTVNPPQVGRQPHQRSLTAGALGVSSGTTIHQATPRARRKFDEFSAALSDGRTLAAVLGDGDDGLPPGAMEVFTAAFTAIKNALIAGDAAAVQQAGADMAAMLVALHQVVNLGSETAERAQRRHVVTRRSLPKIGDVVINGERVPVTEVEFRDGRPVRKQRRRT